MRSKFFYAETMARFLPYSELQSNQILDHTLSEHGHRVFQLFLTNINYWLFELHGSVIHWALVPI